MIITEIAGVHPGGVVSPNQLGAYDDRSTPGLKNLAGIAHQAGVKIDLQIHHSGRENQLLGSQGKALGPSAIPSIVFRTTPREMTLEDIQTVIVAFGSAAGR